MFKSVKIASLVVYVLFVLETIFLAGMFTNMILAGATLLASLIYAVLSVKEKKYTDVLLSMAFVVNVITVIATLY